MTGVHLYDVEVSHTRLAEPRHAFRLRLYTWLVDLDALPRLPPPLRPLARFEARDHLGDPDRTIRENLDRWLATRGVDLRGGRVLMLAHARVLGHVFNPLTVYWCHRPGGQLACVVAEVCNTHGERHCYLVGPGEAAGPGAPAEVAKRFYVSPFLPGHGRYRMRLEPPGERLRLHVELVEGDRTLLTATVRGRRRPATPANLLRAALRHPLVTRRVAASIRRHGIALWLRRAPHVPHRPHAHQEGVR